MSNLLFYLFQTRKKFIDFIFEYFELECYSINDKNNKKWVFIE